MNETVERGIVKWKTVFTGIRGGDIQLHIVKNRVSFIKIFRLRNDDDFNTALRICKDKVARILHMKNGRNNDLARIANYCLDSTSVEEMKEDDTF